MLKVLVTGATGFVGASLVKALLNGKKQSIYNSKKELRLLENN